MEIERQITVSRAAGPPRQPSRTPQGSHASHEPRHLFSETGKVRDVSANSSRPGEQAQQGRSRRLGSFCNSDKFTAEPPPASPDATTTTIANAPLNFELVSFFRFVKFDSGSPILAGKTKLVSFLRFYRGAISPLFPRPNRPAAAHCAKSWIGMPRRFDLFATEAQL